MNVPDIPKEILHLILEYDGRIKYRKGEYINTIHKRIMTREMVIGYKSEHIYEPHMQLLILKRI